MVHMIYQLLAVHVALRTEGALEGVSVRRRAVEIHADIVFIG